MTSIEQLIDEISRLYTSSPQDASRVIEDFLEAELNHLSGQQRISVVQELDVGIQRGLAPIESEKKIIEGIIALLLGRSPAREDLASPEVLERLAESLNTIFDIVNQLIGVINSTLGGNRVGEETIRHVIGFNLDGDSPVQPLQEHLGQIKKAFLVTQQAFKDAASSLLENILTELDPKNMTSSTGGSLKFGPLKKAESFDTYEEKFDKFKKWYESGRFMEDFLRAFEKNCRTLFTS